MLNNTEFLGQETTDMKPKARFIQSILKTAGQNEVAMPWARGSRRAESIARRSAAAPMQAKSA